MPAGRQGAERRRRLAVLCLLSTCLAPALAGADDKALGGRGLPLPAERVLEVPLAVAQVAMADGHLWVASRGGGLLAFRGGRIEKRFDLGGGLPSAVVHDLAVLGDGRLLAGTDRGLVLVGPRSPAAATAGQWLRPVPLAMGRRAGAAVGPAARSRPRRDRRGPRSRRRVSSRRRCSVQRVDATPFTQAGAGLHFISGDGRARFIPLPDRQTQPSGRMLTWPDGRVWVGTRIGVIEADPRGTSRRVSAERVDALYRNEARNVIGAVGATIQHWNGERLAPVMFAIEPRPARPPGHPVDLVIDDEGRWVILYSGGHLVLLDSERRFVATLDARAGVPPTSRRLTYLPKTNEILIGSAHEGVFSLR